MYVYFISAGDAVKIGKAANPKRRLAQLRSGNLHQLEMLGAMKAERNTESEIHRMFDDSRINGEWFRLTPEIRQFIAEKSEPIPEDGRNRHKLDRPKALLIRQTLKQRQLLEQLADALTAMRGSDVPVSFAETVQAGLDALEEKLSGRN